LLLVWYVQILMIQKLAIAAICLAFAGAHPAIDDPREFVRKLVENEIQARSGKPTYWRHVYRAQDSGTVRTEVVIETQAGTLTRLLAQNDAPLTPAQESQENQRFQALIRNPGELKKQAHQEESDAQMARRMIRLLPGGLLYKMESRDERTTRLSFEPNPEFIPPTFESRVFRVVRGTLLLDNIQQRLVEIRGEVFHDLDFGWGLFGKLHKGGTFSVRQDEIEPGQWLMTSIDVNVTGRMWFFRTVGKQMRESRWEFRLLPDSMILQEAAEMIEKDVQEFRSVKPPT
jgi:hypothetical protein